MAASETTMLCDEAATDAVGSERLRTMVQEMMSIRRFEERAAREYAMGHISGFCHLYIGQEGVAVGAVNALKPDDHVITTYRDHGHALIRGCNPRSVMSELMGKATGCSRGRGGSMHLFAPEQNFHGGHGIVGAHIPLAVGFAFASKYEGRDDVALCFFGEGAINQGAFYESVNLASLWDLPVILICENNYYAMGTPLSRASAISDLYTKAAGFNIEGTMVDGMDVCKMWACINEAVRRGREESRPTLIEARCYRFRGHSMSDPAKYRSKEEVDERKANDPIVLASQTLLARGWATEDELKSWDDAAKAAAVDGAEFAQQSPEPDLSTVGDYVYKTPLSWTADEGTTPHRRD